jgi:DNA phosphorothioation-dependent restriction protein DptH
LRTLRNWRATRSSRQSFRITATGVEDVTAVTTETFTLEFGQVPGQLSSASGQVVRTLSEGAIGLATRAAFDAAIAPGANNGIAEDKKGFIIWKGVSGGRGVRVLRPALIRRVETDWATRGGAVGRWIQTVRSDGSPVGELRFKPATLPPGERVFDSCRRLVGELGANDLLGCVLATHWTIVDNYVNA